MAVGDLHHGDGDGLTIEIDDIVIDDLAIGRGDVQAANIVEERGLVDLVAEGAAGRIDGGGARNRLVAPAHLDNAMEINNVAVGIFPAHSLDHLYKHLVGAGLVEDGERWGTFGQHEGAVEPGDHREQSSDEQHEQCKMAQEGAVLAPGEAFGEKVNGAIVVGPRALNVVVPLAEHRLDGIGSTFVGEIRAVMGTSEIAIADDFRRPLDTSSGGQEA